MSSLTPAVRLESTAPFPQYCRDEATGKPVMRPSATERIVIESNAELMDYSIPGSKYGTTSNFVLLHDLQGQPMVLSIGTDKRLYLCAYVNGGAGSWQTFDITPGSNFEALVCDASKSPNSRTILIAVSGHENGNKSNTKLYHVDVSCPKLVADQNGVIQGSAFKNLRWAEAAGRISARQVKTIVCEYFGGDTAYHIIAGVDATTLEGSHHIYDSESADWSIVKFPTQVEKIRSCVPANLPALGAGYIVLSEDNSISRDVSCFFQGNGYAKPVYLYGLQNPTKLSTLTDRDGLSHILIAADNGIGLTDNYKMNDPPRIMLEGIACSNVLGFEHVVSRLESTVSLLATSTHGELFVIEGSRKGSNNDIVEFPASIPISIRDGVRGIAGCINHLTGAFETVYASNDSDTLKHLRRDTVTSMWTEAEMIVKSKIPNKKVKAPAFLVTLTLSNGNGIPVPVGYKVALASSPTPVYINDRSYNLTRRPQIVTANQFGQLQIAIPSGNSLGAAPVEVKFGPSTGDSKTYLIQPAQRVLHTMSSLSNGDALKNAQTSDNRPFFSEDMKQKHHDKFNDAASALSRVPEMVSATQSGGKPSSSSSESMIIAWQKEGSRVSASGTDWVDTAVDAVGEAIGDVMEFLKKVVKSVVKVALKITGPVIRLILKIGAKVIRFVLDSVSSIVISLCTLLEGIFGIDLSSIKNWFTFRYKRVEATQKELAKLIDNGLGLTSRFLHHNHDALDRTIDIFGKFIEGYISRPYQKQQVTKESRGSSILNNPIIANLLKFNPLGWIMEAIAEELGEGVQIPSLEMNIGTQIFRTLKEQFDILLGFLKRSWAGFEAAIGQPAQVMEHLFNIFKDGFWTIFDSLKAIILSIYSLVMNSFDAIIKFCRGKWKIPFITDLWEEITNTDFTLINFVSYIAAQVLELFNATSKPVLENMNLSSVLGDLDSKQMPNFAPKNIKDDIDTYENVSSSSFYDQIEAVKVEQIRGRTFVEANPVKEPRFGLMAKTELPKMAKEERREPYTPHPAEYVRHVLRFAQAGKGLTRPVTLSLQGLVQSESNNNDQRPGNQGRGGRESELADMPDNTKIKLLDQSFISDASTASSLTEVGGGGKTPTKMGGVKAIAIGANAFGLCCRAVEQFVLLNHYNEAGRKAENFEGNCVETMASLLGLILSCFTDSPSLFALSNLAVSAGCFAGTCMAPEKGVYEYSEIVGSGCASLASILFLTKNPTTNTAGWVFDFIDVTNVVVRLGCVKKRLQQGTPVESRPREKSPPRKKIYKVVHLGSDIRATEIAQKYSEVEQMHRDKMGGWDVVMGDLINNGRSFAGGIKHKWEWTQFGRDLSRALREHHHDRFTGTGKILDIESHKKMSVFERLRDFYLPKGAEGKQPMLMTENEFDAYLWLLRGKLANIDSLCAALESHAAVNWEMSDVPGEDLS
ncbi:Fc.00g106660.m01.CDS01 [Cosmosporella sp. VM-42]